MQLFELFKTNDPNKIDKCLECLGITNYQYPDKEILLNEICLYIFETKVQPEGQKVFDLKADYKYYFCDFLRCSKGINLNTDDISWWEFNALLESFFLDEKSTISTVLGYRTYKKPSANPKVQENNQNKFYNEMKRKYALKISDNTDNGLQKLWNYVEGKVKE